MIGFAVAFFAASLPNAVVLQPVANMYSKATEDADVVSQAIYGANVSVMEQGDGWARIRTPDDYSGWMPLASLRAGAPYAAAGQVVQVTSLRAHIYRENSVTRHAPLLTAPFETRLEVIEAKEHWVQVRLPDGRTGYVQTGDVTANATRIGTAEMLALGKKFLGLPYTWGGASSFGYDCSGFVQMLERRRGVNMPRDAQPQADWSGVVPVSRKDVEAGDLLYFGASDKHITHTGMYLGDGKFINATTHLTPMVRIDELDDPYWTRLLVAIRRVK
jgi:gamma-D-glutamyl-L-lysine dipeptidyl-peptidase